MDKYQFLDQLKKDTYVWFEDHHPNDPQSHTHSLAQFIYVAKGFQYLHTEEKTYLLPQNFAAWIPANTLHRTESQAKNLQLHSLFYKIDTDVAFYNEIQLFSAAPVLKEMIFYAEKWNKSTEDSLAEERFLKTLLWELPNMGQVNSYLQLSYPKHPTLKAICSYLEHELENDISIMDLAFKFNISERTLQRLFKKETGQSLAKYIQYLRIMKSIEYLESTDFSISEIAYKVGYKSVQAFSNSFYDILRRRPKEFCNH